MWQRKRLTSAEAKKRLLSALQNWVETVFFSALIEKMRESGVTEGSLTAKVTHATLLQHIMKKSFTIFSPTTATTAHLYDAEATLSSLWELTTPSGTVRRTIHFKVRAKICLADWEGVTDFEVESIEVEGSDFLCGILREVVSQSVEHSEIRTQGEKALSLLKFDEDGVREVAYFILLHFLPSAYNFLSQKAAEIENALIHTLTTLPPLSIEFLDGTYTYKMKDVSRKAIKTFGSITTIREDWEFFADELKVIVEGVWEGEGRERELLIRVVVLVTLRERRRRGEETQRMGGMEIEVGWVWGREFSPPYSPPHTRIVLNMKVENTKESIEQFFTKVVEAINSGEIERLIRKIPGVK